MTMTISFPGGVAVEAEFKGNTVRTDQPAPLGAASAMSPASTAHSIPLE